MNLISIHPITLPLKSLPSSTQNRCLTVFRLRDHLDKVKVNSDDVAETKQLWRDTPVVEILVLSMKPHCAGVSSSPLSVFAIISINLTPCTLTHQGHSLDVLIMVTKASGLFDAHHFLSKTSNYQMGKWALNIEVHNHS
jgi:hypothetical protein